MSTLGRLIIDQHLLDGGDQGCILLSGDLLTSLSEMRHKKLSFRLLSSELGGQTSAKPLSHGLPRVFIEYSWILFKSNILWALLKPQCSSVVLSFDIKLFVMFLLHENWSTPWKNPSQCCRRCCWSQPSLCWSSRRRSLWQGLLPDLPVASCLLLMAKKTLLLLSRGRKESFNRITSKLCWRLGQ